MIILVVGIAWCVLSFVVGFGVGAAISIRDRGGPGL